MQLASIALPLAWLTLIGAPVLALVVAGKSSGGTLAVRALASWSAAYMGLVAAAWATGIEFFWRPLNWFALSGGYCAWACVVGCVVTLRPRWFGALLSGLGWLTFAPGIAVSTIGLLGLMFIVGDYASPPREVRTLAPGLDCVVTDWGSAVSDDGHDVHLDRYWPWLPLTRRQVRYVVVDETHPRPGVPETIGCREVAATL